MTSAPASPLLILSISIGQEQTVGGIGTPVVDQPAGGLAEAASEEEQPAVPAVQVDWQEQQQFRRKQEQQPEIE